MLKMKDLVTRVNDAEWEVLDWHARRHTAWGRRRLTTARRRFSTLSVDEGGGRNPYYNTQQEDSTKLSHNGVQEEWVQTVIYMSAHRSSGVINMCPWATKQCIAACLGHTSGRLVMDSAQTAQRVRTMFLVDHTPDALIVMLAEHERDAKRIHAISEKAKYAARLNGTTEWPLEECGWFMVLLAAVGVDQFIDYGKGVKPHNGKPRDLSRTPNGIRYHVAPSATEHTLPDDVEPGHVIVLDLDRHDPMPDTWNGMPLFDGDNGHGDLRHLDPEGYVIGLRKKGNYLGSVVGADDGFVKPASVAVAVRV